jgi:hypothetical protein
MARPLIDRLHLTLHSALSIFRCLLGCAMAVECFDIGRVEIGGALLLAFINSYYIIHRI